MPEGIGYPLPPPPGLLAGQPVGLPRPMLPMADQPLPASVLSSEVPTALLPAPVMPEEQAEIPPPPIVTEQGMPAPWWIQQVQGGEAQAPGAAQTVAAQAGAPMAAAPESDQPSDEFVLPDGVAPDSPVGLTMRGLWTQQQAQKAKVQQLELAGQAIKEADARTAKRIEEAQARQVAARERVATQNAEIQQALRSGPGGTWRDVMATGAGVLGAVLGAAFDRSGTLQKQLPQTLNALVDAGQKRMQEAFGRQIQALQVGREAAGDDLDAALAEDRQIEQAGAATRLAILEEADRQIKRAAENGQLDLMELQRIGVPQQMEAEIEAARAKQAQIAEEQARKDLEFQTKQRAAEADIAYKAEQVLSERADRAKQRADIALDKERLELQRKAQETQSVKDAVDLHGKQLDVALKNKEIEAKDLSRAIILPDGRPILLNSTAEGSQKQGVAKVTTARKLGRLVDEITQAAERTGYDPKWLGSTEGQKTRLLWRKLWLSVKDQEELGAITGPDEQILDDVTGADPTSFSPEALRGTAERLKLLKRTTEDEVDDYLATASSDYVAKGKRFELQTLEDPQAAVPTAADARSALVPMQSAASGKRPRVPASEYSAAVKTVRETVAKEVGASDRDAVLRGQAEALGSALQEAREERARIERERQRAEETRRRLGDTRRSPQAREWADKEAALIEERKTIEGYEKRLAEALKRERKLLWERTGFGNPRIKASEADRAAYRRVANLIGDLGGKPAARE